MTFTELVDDCVLLQRIASTLDHLPAGRVPVAIRHQHPLLNGVELLWGIRVVADPVVAAGEFTIDASAPVAVRQPTGGPRPRPRPRPRPPSSNGQQPVEVDVDVELEAEPKPDPEQGPGGLVGWVRRWWRQLDGGER